MAHATFRPPTLGCEVGTLEPIGAFKSVINVCEAIHQHPDFRDLGKHMLLAWNEGIQTLRDKSHHSLPQPQNENLLGGISDPPKMANTKIIVGQSEAVGTRRS